MGTVVRRVTRKQLVAKRREILEELGLSDEEFIAKVKSGGLVGREWAAWSDIEDIDYLLDS